MVHTLVMHRKSLFFLKTDVFVNALLMMFHFRVIDGLDVVDELEKLPVNPKNYKPTTETRINNITIHANPIAG